MNNNSSVVVFDTETTGINTSVDQIIEITIQTGLGSDATFFTRRVKPLIPISPQATAVHGITAQDLVICPTFAELAEEIASHFEGIETVVGYNVTFDLEILQAEFARAGYPPLDLIGRNFVDPLQIWKHYERRSLSSAYRRFVGGTFENAHSAEADVKATAAVLQGMLKAFEIEDVPFAELSKLTYPPEWVGFSYHIQWKRKLPTFAFGKFSGRSVWEVVRKDASYVTWIETANFPPHVVEICRAGLKTDDKTEFLKVVRERFGEAAA
jgi:DNA polymerase-3 subunit epsilon